MNGRNGTVKEMGTLSSWEGEMKIQSDGRSDCYALNGGNGKVREIGNLAPCKGEMEVQSDEREMTGMK